MKKIGIYIHIPFCIKKCDYCDFISYSDKNNLVECYIKNLKEEITEVLQKEDYKVQTIYIGGGTPSSIHSKHIVEILETIQNAKIRYTNRNNHRSKSRNNYETEIIRL